MSHPKETSMTMVRSVSIALIALMLIAALPKTTWADEEATPPASGDLRAAIPAIGDSVARLCFLPRSCVPASGTCTARWRRRRRKHDDLDAGRHGCQPWRHLLHRQRNEKADRRRAAAIRGSRFWVLSSGFWFQVHDSGVRSVRCCSWCGTQNPEPRTRTQNLEPRTQNRRFTP